MDLILKKEFCDILEYLYSLDRRKKDFISSQITRESSSQTFLLTRIEKVKSLFFLSFFFSIKTPTRAILDWINEPKFNIIDFFVYPRATICYTIFCQIFSYFTTRKAYSTLKKRQYFIYVFQYLRFSWKILLAKTAIRSNYMNWTYFQYLGEICRKQIENTHFLYNKPLQLFCYLIW